MRMDTYKKTPRKWRIVACSGGRGEIRTHGGREPTTVFKTVALNRSATLPLTMQDYTKQLHLWKGVVRKNYVCVTESG